MPHTDPELLLERFSGFLYRDVRSTIEEDQLLHAQLGSLSSTLRLLAKELEHYGSDIETQRVAFERALERVDDRVDTDQTIASAIDDARNRLDAVPEYELREKERTILAEASRLLETIEDECCADRAGELRAPLYAFVKERTATQLETLGRGNSSTE
jgi:hypothetical protein